MVADKRMFRLDRIKSISLTDDTFPEPSEQDAELPPPLVYVPAPDDQLVRIRVAKGIAQWLGDYLPVDRRKELRGGKEELEFRTSAFPWLEKLLLRFGSDVEVVEPRELADNMRDAAGRILALYEPRKR
jgi:predicted DNA-binding transcriptional regulator YafY